MPPGPPWRTADFPDSGADAPVPRSSSGPIALGRWGGFRYPPCLGAGVRGPARIGPVYRRISRPPLCLARVAVLSPRLALPPKRRARLQEAAVKKLLFLPIFAVALASPAAIAQTTPATTPPSATTRAVQVQPVQEYFIPFADAPASLDYYNTPIGYTHLGT